MDTGQRIDMPTQGELPGELSDAGAADSGPASDWPEDKGSGPSRPPRRLWWWALAVLGVLAVAGVGGWFGARRYNNVPRWDEQQLAEALDASIERGLAWLGANVPLFFRTGTVNAAMFVMMQDMHAMRYTPLFEAFLGEFSRLPMEPPFWKKLVEPERPVSVAEMNDSLPRYPVDYRWTVYALHPQGVELAPRDLQLLFDPEGCKARRMAHQLWSLWQMRRISKDPRASDALMERLCQRLAEENRRDVRPLDLYFERVAFILMAGHPELVNRRWVERIIESQNADGGWDDRWWGMTTTSDWNDLPGSNEHASLLAMWTLYQVRYRYAEHFGLPAIAAEVRSEK